MTKDQIALLYTVLDFGYFMIVQDFPGLPKEEWFEEVITTFSSDRDFWLAAHPGSTTEDFLEEAKFIGKDNPLREAAENVMRRHRHE
jgi:hypothetical protein